MATSGGGKSYIYCPFATPDEASLAFFSGLFGRSEREDIVSTFVFYGMPAGWIYALDKRFNEVFFAGGAWERI